MLKKILYLLAILLVVGGFVAYKGYTMIYNNNVNEESNVDEIKIPSGSGFDDVVKIMEELNVLKDVGSFKNVAKAMKYDKASVPAGIYPIKQNQSNRQLISLLRSGRQKAVNVTFNNKRTVHEALGQLSQYFESDSIAFVDYFLDTQTLKEAGYNDETILTMMIPNTYQMYWTDKPDKVFNRLKKEHDSFWSKNNRLAKAKKKNLSKKEVYTLASIVEKESQAAKERPIIAGLYLNRLDIGMPLQADPTVVFAVGDFTIRRVLNKHLAYDSPYNTYKYSGLPPGPIYLPSIQSIDAVLSPAKHKYLYMCAKPGYNSEHAFAESDVQHIRNANRYRAWLNSEGIRR